MSSAEKDVLLKAERALVWKLDLILMPILTITLGLQFYDKAVLGSASVFGIIADLGLSEVINGATVTTRYSTATAAFYYGYIIAVLPMALIFARVQLARAAAIVVFVWGVVCILTVVVQNYEGLVVQRVFLGLMESAVSPAFVAITCLWYKPGEQSKRLGIWYSATGIFSMISGALNYGLGSAGGALHPWKYMYLFAGSITIAWSFVILFFLPASPLQPGRHFNADEKLILLRRFEENPWGKDRQKFVMSQFVEAILDIKTWIYLLLGAAIYICNGSVTAFGARIISSFGYTALQAIALQIPGGAFTCVFIYVACYFADRFKNVRTYILPITCIPIIVGAVVLWQAPWNPRGIPLFGYYLVASFGAPYVLLLTIASANVVGTTKKAVTSGAIFIGYNAGNIAAAYLVFTPEASVKYRSTWISVIVAMCFTIAASFFLRFLFMRENARRNSLGPQATPRSTSEDEKNAAVLEGHTDIPIIDNPDNFVDLTDKQRPDFRYVL